MSNLDASVWEGLSEDHREAGLAKVTAVRVASAGLWSFLAQAQDRDDFVNRLELVRPRLEATASEHGPEVLAQVEAAFCNDFETMLQARKTAGEEYHAAPGIDEVEGRSYKWADPEDVRAVQQRFDSRKPVVKHPTEPNTLIHDPENFWDGPSHITKHGPGHYSWNNWTEHWGDPTKTDADREEHFDGEGNTMFFGARRATAAFPGPGAHVYRTAGDKPPSYDDPTGARLGENPAAWNGGSPDPQRAYEQSGAAQSSLPYAPQGSMAQNFGTISDFPDTGPTEVNPSDQVMGRYASQRRTAADSILGQPSAMGLLAPGGSGYAPPQVHPEIRQMVNRTHVAIPDHEVADMAAQWAERAGWQPHEYPHQRAVEEALAQHHHNQDEYARLIEHRGWPRQSPSPMTDPNQGRFFASKRGGAGPKVADKAPYYVESHGGKYVVVNSAGEVKGTHSSKGQARQQQKALYANVPDARAKAERDHGDPKPKVKTSAWSHTASQRLEALYNQGFEFEGALACPACPSTFFSETERLTHMASHREASTWDQHGQVADYYTKRKPGPYSEHDDAPPNVLKRLDPDEYDAWLSAQRRKTKKTSAAGCPNCGNDNMKPMGAPNHDHEQCGACGYKRPINGNKSSTLPQARPSSWGRRAAATARRLVVAERNPEKKACPYCGKMVDIKRLARHIEEEHPHQAVPIEAEEAAKGKSKKEGAMGNPNVPDTGQGDVNGESDTPDDTGPDMTNTPGAPKMAAAYRNAVEKIALDLYQANPGLSEPQRIHIASETVRRFPSLVHEARGGFDFLPADAEEELSDCPQCGKEALDAETGACHWCGAQFKPGSV